MPEFWASAVECVGEALERCPDDPFTLLHDHVHISASTTVTRSISEPGLYTGMFPIDTNKAWEKNAVTLRQLHELRERIRTLEKTLTPP